MVKNVKDSKVLEKIRTRDGAFDFLIFLESHKDEVRQLKNKEEMSRLFSKYNMSLLRENTNALWERVQEIKKTKDSKAKVKDMKVTITLEEENASAEPAPEELIPFEGEIYKGFEDCGISGLWSTL